MRLYGFKLDLCSTRQQHNHSPSRQSYWYRYEIVAYLCDPCP